MFKEAINSRGVIMKYSKIKFLMGLILLTFFLLIGCITYPVEYSFIFDDQNYATIGFQTRHRMNSPSVSFVSLDGRSLPRAEFRTHWDPITFPAGRELRMVVRARYQEERVRVEGFGLLGAMINTASDISQLTRNVDAEVSFTCPPLEPNGRYQLSFRKGSGIPGSNTLMLIDLTTGRVVYEREFELIFGGYRTRD